jgi:hypothetical protein
MIAVVVTEEGRKGWMKRRSQSTEESCPSLSVSRTDSSVSGTASRIIRATQKEREDSVERKGNRADLARILGA